MQLFEKKWYCNLLKTFAMRGEYEATLPIKTNTNEIVDWLDDEGFTVTQKKEAKQSDSAVFLVSWENSFCFEQAGNLASWFWYISKGLNEINSFIYSS